MLRLALLCAVCVLSIACSEHAGVLSADAAGPSSPADASPALAPADAATAGLDASVAPDAALALADAAIADAAIAPDAALLADASSPLDAATAAGSDAGPTVLTGQLVGGSGAWPGGIEGVHFRSGGQSGYTDATGGFAYEQGASIVFGVSDVEFRATAGAAMLSPWQLAAQGACAQGDELTRLLVLLYSLDADGDPSTGTHLTSFPTGTPVRALSTLTDADVAALIAALIPGRAPVAGSDAVDLFITQMDGELWTQLSMDTFDTADSAQRSQGVTTDGTDWYFSWRLGLQKTDLAYNVLMKNLAAIPPALLLLGSDHIGDLDYWNGLLYAPVEDSQAYKSPMIVQFDLSLNSGQIFPLSNTLLTQGVPWVAVDGPRASVYVAQWDPTPGILVHALADLSYQRTLALTTTMHRIQGAKVFEGALYANCDDTGKTVYKVNLETGTVIQLFALNQQFEVEGLAFLARPDSSLMHTLNATTDATAMEFRHHQRTREPLRKRVCP